MIQVSHMVEYLHETFYKHAFEYVEPVRPETNEKKQNQTETPTLLVSSVFQGPFG